MFLTQLASASDTMFTGLLSSLSPSDIIQLLGILLSTIISTIAVIISVVTLRQNHQMVEESTRSYIVVYTAATNFQSPMYYLVIKNFGQTGARITSFSCDFDLAKCSYSPKYIPFEHIKDTFIAPNQSFVCNVNPREIFEDPKPITISIAYEANKRTYTDSFVLNIKADSDLIHSRAASKDKELKIISYTLQDMVEKML